jgi:hypothetical protein
VVARVLWVLVLAQVLMMSRVLVLVLAWVLVLVLAQVLVMSWVLVVPIHSFRSRHPSSSPWLLLIQHPFGSYLHSQLAHTLSSSTETSHCRPAAAASETQRAAQKTRPRTRTQTGSLSALAASEGAGCCSASCRHSQPCPRCCCCRPPSTSAPPWPELGLLLGYSWH